MADITYSVGNKQIIFPYFKEMEALATMFFVEKIPEMGKKKEIVGIDQLACFTYFIQKCANEYLEILIDVLLEKEKEQN